MRSVALASSLALCAAPTALHADDAPADDQPVMQLGTVEVQGSEKIVATLRAIKVTLKAPFSDDPARANDPVCRIVKQLGDAREYLTAPLTATSPSHVRRPRPPSSSAPWVHRPAPTYGRRSWRKSPTITSACR